MVTCLSVVSRHEIKRFSPYTGTERDCKRRRRDTKRKREREREGKRRSVQRSLTRWDAADALASTPSSFVVSESVPPALFPPCSPNAFPPPFFISLYGLIPSFPRRARYIYRLVSPSGSCLYHTATSPGPACRSPSKTVSPPRFMFPPTQRRIDPFLLSDVYV